MVNGTESSFFLWMKYLNGGLMIGFIFVLLCFISILPITILLHELGHFFCALLCKASRITITIGIGKKIGQLKSKNSTLILHMLPLSGKTSYELVHYSKYRQILISIGGPVLNGFVGFLLLLPGIGHGDQLITFWFQWLALFNVWMFFVNILPFKFGKYSSDGWVVINSLK